jgi:hypothetical protein
MASSILESIKENVGCTIGIILVAFEKIDISKGIKDILFTPDGIFAILLFLLGTFYCLLGSRFQKFSAVTILTVVVFSVLQDYSQFADPLAHPIDGLIKPFLLGSEKTPPSFLPSVFIDIRKEIKVGYIVLALAITLIISYLAPLGEWCALFGFFFYAQKALKGAWTGDPLNFPYIHICAAFLLTFLIYLIMRMLESILITFLSCSSGSAIILLATNKILKSPKSDFGQFVASLLNLNFSSMELVPLLYFVLLVSFSMIFQLTCYKNKK